MPFGHTESIRGLHTTGRAINVALSGQRTAVNLPDVKVEEIARGSELATKGVFRATSRLDARISLLASARPLKSRIRVHFHCGSAERIALINLLDTDSLAPRAAARSEERRVGKECRSRWSPDHCKKKSECG